LAAGLAACVATQVTAGSRLPGTGGVSEVEGAAGGGIVPWALIAGYGTREESGADLFLTRLASQGFRLTAAGVAFGWHDRLELSYARQRFNLGSTVPGQQIDMDVVGAKWRLAGHAIFDQDRPWPQLALGLMAKQNRSFDRVPAALGARHASDVEPYLAAAKVWLDGIAGRTTLLDATLRLSRANQLGLLGFGGDRSDRRKALAELSAAVFINDHWVIGSEWRQKPDNLTVFKEQRFADAFVAWLPDRRWSVTLAQAELGNIADKPNQRGPYLSLKLDF
jgi:hypothetical protein